MILVTGATGLVGAHLLLDLLKQKQTVKALYKNPKSIHKVQQLFAHYNKTQWLENIIWCQGSLLDIPLLTEAFADVQYVYHCGAYISFDPKDEELLRKTNITGTANIVNLCIDFKIKKLCYVSSVAALGDLQENQTQITENSPWNPETQHNDYAISKYGAELEVWRAQQEGLPVVIVNPGVILGPLFWQNGSGKIYQTIKNKPYFYTTGGTGFISVLDVVTTMIFLMNSQISKQRFILVAETLSYKDLINCIAQKLQVPPPKYHATPTITAIAWRIDYIVALFTNTRKLTKQISQTLHTTTYYNTNKIQKAQGKTFESIASYIQKL